MNLHLAGRLTRSQRAWQLCPSRTDIVHTPYRVLYTRSLFIPHSVSRHRSFPSLHPELTAYGRFLGVTLFWRARFVSIVSSPHVSGRFLLWLNPESFWSTGDLSSLILCFRALCMGKLSRRNRSHGYSGAETGCYGWKWLKTQRVDFKNFIEGKTTAKTRG